MKQNRRKLLIQAILSEDAIYCPPRFINIVTEAGMTATPDTGDAVDGIAWKKDALNNLQTKHLHDLVRLIPGQKKEAQEREVKKAGDVSQEMIIRSNTKVEVRMLPGNQVRIVGHSDPVVFLYAVDMLLKSFKNSLQQQMQKAEQLHKEKRIATPEDEMWTLTDMRKVETTIEVIDELWQDLAFGLRDKMKKQHEDKQSTPAGKKKIVVASAFTSLPKRE